MVLEGSPSVIMIINMHFCGLQSILRCILLFELRDDTVGRQNEHVVRNMNKLYVGQAA